MTSSGFISNEKPSAIFKIAKPQGDDVVDKTVQLGISIEPLVALIQMADKAKKESPSFQEDLAKINKKILEHLYNFATGFVQKNPQTQEDLFPTDVLDKWLTSIQNKCKTEPNWYWPHTTPKPTTPEDVAILAMKLAKNLYTYVLTEAKISLFGQAPAITFIPVSMFNKWAETMKTKIEKDASWWKY